MIRARPAISLIAACLALAVVDAKAEDWSMGLHVASIHAPQHEQANDNAGLYVRHGQWAAGGYRNSHRRNTFYAGYALPVGPVELMAGFATGYDKRCTKTTTHTPKVVKVEQLPDGGTSTTTYPARTHTTEECAGFSKHRLTPLVALSYAAPFSFLGATPRGWLMPGFGKVSTVAHISLEWSLQP